MTKDKTLIDGIRKVNELGDGFLPRRGVADRPCCQKAARFVRTS